jgi:ferredoxin-NADP reductase
MGDTQIPNSYLFRIRKIISETPDAKSFVLEPVNDQRIAYVPGQFLTFLFTKANGKEERRNYSISSTHVNNEPLTITVKRIPNGEYSRRLIDTMHEGDILTTIGASGFFTLPGNMDPYDQFVFFAAGSGITPVYALIKTLLNNHPSTKVVLIYSNSTPEHTIFYQQLKEYQKKFPERLYIEFLFSNSTRIFNKRLSIYLLENFLEKYITGTINRQLFYLCGPFEYMRMITIVLRNKGVAAANIRKEVFTIEKPDRKTKPPDKERHCVTVTLHAVKYNFDTQYPQTILQSAKALNIPLPYSCESGQCGTCAATCISGKVWMWRNDVLLDEEMAKGRVLTCTGFAVDGDVRLEY